MKKIILLLLIGFSGSSQNIAISQIDEFTKLEILQINASKDKKWKGTDNIAKGLFNYVFLSLKKVGLIKILQLDTQIGSVICINNNEDKIILLLDNNNTIQLQQESKLDCAQRVVPKYLITEEQIKILSECQIKKIRIYTNDGYIEIEIKEDKKELIKNTFLLFKNKT